MFKGSVRCLCGQLFAFETTQDAVQCPTCMKEFSSADYGVDDTPRPIPLENPFKPPITEGGDSDGISTD